MNAEMNRPEPRTVVVNVGKPVMVAGVIPMLVLLLIGVVALGAAATLCVAQEKTSEKDENERPEASLRETQRRITARFRQFERMLLRMAELSASTNPSQAALLRRVIAESRERLLSSRFDELAELLEDKKYTSAIQANKELYNDLISLLDLLRRAEGINRLKEEQKLYQEWLKKIKNLRRKQVHLQMRTDQSQNLEELAPPQKKLAEKTSDLKNRMQNPSDEGKSGQGKSGKGKSGQGKSGQDRLYSTKSIEERLQTAQERMKNAQKALEDARKKGALEEQEAAKRELEQAQKELEEILRQIREEIQEKTLLALEDRIRRMLRRQNGVWEGTQKLDKVPPEKRDKQHEINAGRLGTREAEIVGIADQTMLLFREDGTVAAMPEALSQAREDMRQVVTRLNRADVGALTIEIEEDVIDALKEMLDAIEKELQKLEERKSGRSRQTRMNQPLVDRLAELKMLLSMEKGIKRHTVRLERLTADPKADEADLLERHRVLARRQERIYEITQAIASGMNQ